MLDYRRAEMVELIADMQATNAEVRRDFAPLTAAQINWKPNSKEWSVAGCLEHMAITDARYIPQFDALLSEEKRPTLAERLPIVPALSVRLLLRFNDPTAPMNIKTLPGFYPTAETLDRRSWPNWSAYKPASSSRCVHFRRSTLQNSG